MSDRSAFEKDLVEHGAFEGTGRFEVLRHLGSGGMGSVFEALDRQSGARLAIKTIERASGAALYALKQEFRSLADIRHPNLVQLFELVSDGDRWFFTMELVDGVDFLSFVCPGRRDHEPADSDAETRRYHPGSAAVERRERSPLESRRARVDMARLETAFTQLCEGVEALHRADKVHRDIKPSNVLVTHSGRVVVLDFGLVEDLSEPRRDTHSIEGTIAYMSPEQAGQRPSVPASDWYAVGVMLYEALTGQLPFDGTAIEVLAMKLMGTPTPPRELNPEVSPAWNDVCLALLERDPDERAPPEILSRLGVEPPTDEAASLASVRKSTPFVGRSTELDTLHESWTAKARTEAAVVVIGGASGIGKTALIDRFIEKLEGGPPAWLFEARCYERETLPFKAFDAIIDSVSLCLLDLDDDELERVLPQDIRYLSGVFPVLRRVRAIESDLYDRPLIPEANELRRRAFACLCELLANLTRSRPMLVFIDDFQWADEDSYELFRSLIDSPALRRVMFLLSSRPEAASSEGVRSRLAELTAHLRARASTRFIELTPLNREDAARLTAAILNQLPSATTSSHDGERLVAAVVEESEGSPFFVHEMTRHLLRGAPDAERSVTLQTMMAERLDDLPAAGRALLRLIALAGDPLPQSVLSSAIGLSMGSDAWTAALSSLAGAGLVRRHGLRRTDSAEVYHDRIRRAVCAELGTEQEELHRRLAEALESDPETRPGRLVRHWLGASEPDRALTHMQAAIEEANAQLAFGRAVQLYREALEVETDPTSRPGLYKGLGHALANVGRPHEAAEAYLAGAAQGPVASRLELENLAAGKLLQGGYITEGVEALGGVLSLVGIKTIVSPTMLLASVVYQQLMLRIEGTDFREREVSEIPREELLRLDVLRSASTGFSIVDTIRGADFQVRVLRQALATGEIGRISEALAQHGAYSAGLGGKHIEKGREAVARAAELAERAEDPRLVALANGSLAMIEYWAGNWDQTVHLFRSSEQTLLNRCHGVHWELATARMFLGLGLMRLGEMHELGERYDTHVEAALRMGDHFGAAGLKTRHNSVWLARDRPDRAAMELQGALSTWPAESFHIQHFWALFAKCERLLYENQPREAERLMDAGIGPLKRSLLMRVQMVRVETTELRGRIALALAADESDQGGRRALLARARGFARSLSKEGVGFASAWGSLLFAGVDRLSDQKLPAAERGAGTLREAIEQLEHARLHLYAAAARRRDGQLIGGDEGRALVEAADRWMLQKGIVDPSRMTSMLTPAHGE